MHATCTTQDIGSWWYLKFRLLCAIVKGYFRGCKTRAILRGYRIACPIIARRRFDTRIRALLEIVVFNTCKAASFHAFQRGFASLRLFQSWMKY
jgi:hypothetical protein